MIRISTMDNKLTRICFWSAIIVFVFAIVVFAITIWSLVDISTKWLRPIGDFAWNNPGDFLWGFSGILLTTVSAILMFITFKSQQSQFEITSASSHQERFENTFYNLMDSFRNVRKMAENEVDNNPNLDNESRDSFEAIWNKLNHSYSSLSSSDILIQNSEKLRSGYNCIAIKDTQNNINEFVNEFLEDNKLNLSFYFRFLENTIDFVISQWNGVKESDANIRKYLSFLQAQMNDFELALVFYFALSDRAKSYDKQLHLKNNIDEYGFLAYMPDTVLLDRNHQKIYTHTMFLFLGAKERQEKTKFIEGRN